MKYFSSQSVADAYKNFQSSMTNKAWGYLALLKECGEMIKSSTLYEINLDNVSNFLEGIFNLNDYKKTYNGEKSIYVVFSNQWKDYFNTQGDTLPNIYDVAVWAFRRNSFAEKIDTKNLLTMFASTFNIPIDVLRSCFDITDRRITYVDSLYSETELKTKLQHNGVDVSKNNIDAQNKSVVANPGEISRGPFVQPLYAGLEITDYVIILQSDYEEIYGSAINSAMTQKPYTSDELVRFYKNLVTSNDGTAGNSIFMVIYGKRVKELNLTAADIHNKAIELYPSEKTKFRSQELSQAFRMYEYFEKHPNKMHLPSILDTSIHKHTNPASISKYNNYFAALRTKPFMLLAGISGTGKSRIVRKFAQASVTEELQKQYDPKSVEKGFNRWKLHKPANFELIQVKPNWHNSLEVVGYKSNIGGAHYEFTPFVEFVTRAWRHPKVPFFLCLDEMNLAPVEQYFAEFLSAIESRSIENGEYETDPIIKPFVEFGDEVCNMMINHLLGKVDVSDAASDSRIVRLATRFKTKGLTLPQNLLVLGTVNMDETTFSFSRKVLDRAMSVVMNEVNYEDFFNGDTENDMAEMDDDTMELLIERPIRGLDADSNYAEEVQKYLTEINKILEDTPFKLGYRAANEALLYVSAAHMFNPYAGTNAALDEFAMMKVLSRIEGDKRSIGTLLDDLQKVITTGYPKSKEKLVKMAKTLNDKQFVSYWT